MCCIMLEDIMLEDSKIFQEIEGYNNFEESVCVDSDHYEITCLYIGSMIEPSHYTIEPKF